jgi:3-oxoacyl-[acyl-carrier protein] reductase
MYIAITGSSSGIGRAMTERLVAIGHRVFGLARRKQTDVANSCRDCKGSFHDYQCDVSDWVQIEQTARMIDAGWHRLDALITCAGVHGEVGRSLTCDPAKWHATVNANLGGTFNAVRVFHPLLSKTTSRAKVICLSGGGATKARANFSAYAAAKTGIVRLVETIAVEEAARNLDINAVAPGAINTRLTDEIIALGSAVVGASEYEAARNLQQKGGNALESTVELVEFLLSPDSDGISGRLISAQWDPWRTFSQTKSGLKDDIYTLRRILPEDRVRK